METDTQDEYVELTLWIDVYPDGEGYVARVPALGIRAVERTREDAIFRARMTARYYEGDSSLCSPRGHRCKGSQGHGAVFGDTIVTQIEGIRADGGDPDLNDQ